MVVIRLARVGAKKCPFYHVVATDRRRARNSGNYIERLGYFNPVARGGELRLHLDHDRINHWLRLGAQPSDRVSSLVAEAGKAAAGLPTSVQKRKAKRADKRAKTGTRKEQAAAKKAVDTAEAPAPAEQPAAE